MTQFAMESIDQFEPYHSRYFDVISIAPVTPVEEAKQLAYIKYYVSIMCYEDAILTAIHDLKDVHGSSVHAIKKHIQSNLLHENYPTLNDSEMEALVSELAPPMVWKDSLFLQALKSVEDKNCVTHAVCSRNGSTTYSLSLDYKKHRAKEIRNRLERLEAYKVASRSRIARAKERKEIPHAHVPILKKGHLVEPKAVVIVQDKKDDIRGKKKMDVDTRTHDKTSLLPHHSTVKNLHADDTIGLMDGKNKSLRAKTKIPHCKIVVSQM
jgi:hypothetical protein